MAKKKTENNKHSNTVTKKNVVWTSKRVDSWMKDYSEGVIHKDNPWLDGTIGVRNPSLVFEYTPKEIEELTKCAEDIMYFANNYCYCLQGSRGYQPLTLRDYQEEMLTSYANNRFSICCASRQIGKTVVAGVFLLHSAIFNFDKNIGIAANKFATAVEIMDKMKEMMDYLPFFMKPGIKVNNQSMMVFSNGCRIISQATTKKSFIGFSINYLYLDEFSHVEPHVLDEFYENIMPTVSSMEDSKIIITSTPNGYNKFYDIYQGAVDGRNSYHPIRVDWWQVPGRDDKWRDKMIEDCGGEDEFMRQYGNSFLSTGNTLLSPDSLAKLQRMRTKYKKQEIGELSKVWDDEYENLLFHPDFDIAFFKDNTRRWIMSVDLAEGGGGDNSVINMFEIKEKPHDVIQSLKNADRENKKSDYFQLVQVGRFKSNTCNLETLAKLLYTLVMKTICSDNVRIVCEYNAFGGEFLRLLQNVFGDKNEFDISTVLKFKHSIEAEKAKYGLKVRNDNKPIMCIALKGYIADDSIVVTDADTIGEFEVFSKSGNSWKASRDHDDLAMSVVNVTSVFDHPYFEVMMEEIMSDELLKEYMEEVDEKYGNLYDNYNNIGVVQPNTLRMEYYNYEPVKELGYFGNDGLYS